jgi:hypothetical protein
MDEKITYNLREEWVEKYLSKIASVMMEASEHAETLGEVMLMRKFSEVVENYLSFDEEGDPDEAIRN